MAEQTEVIRQQMEETRAAMSEKVEALEKQVGETVKDTAQTVAETVHAASETIDKTVSTVSETVQAVTETFNISGHIEKHPWAAFGTAVALGYVVGSLIPSGRSPRQPTPQPAATPSQPLASGPMSVPAGEPAAGRHPMAGQASGSTPAEEPSHDEPAAEQQGPSLMSLFGSLKGLAVGTAVSVFGQVIMNALPQDMRGGLSSLVNDLTEYLGGKPPV